MTTRRDHPTAGVAPAVQIEGFNPVSSPKARVAPDLHKGVALHQHCGNSSNGHAVSPQRLPSHPIDASPNTPRPTKAPAVSWGHESAPWPHDPAKGDAILKEATISGSARLSADDVPHSCITKRGC